MLHYLFKLFYYTFFLQTVLLGAAIVLILMMPLLGIGIYDVLINLAYRRWVPKAAARAGDTVLGTRPVLPLGSLVGRPILWTGSDRRGRLLLFSGRDADRMLRALARRQHGGTILLGDPARERSYGALADRFAGKKRMPPSPLTEATPHYLRSLVNGEEPCQVFIADVGELIRRFPDLAPLILQPPSHIAMTVSAESLAALPAAFADELIEAAHYYVIFRQTPEDLEVLRAHAPEVAPKASGGFGAFARPRPVKRADLQGATRLRRRRCLVIVGSMLEGEVICWTQRATAVPLLL